MSSGNELSRMRDIHAEHGQIKNHSLHQSPQHKVPEKEGAISRGSHQHSACWEDESEVAYLERVGPELEDAAKRVGLEIVDVDSP